VDVPAEEERGIAAESDSTNERLPCWLQEEFDEKDLFVVSAKAGISTILLTTWKNNVKMNVTRGGTSGSTAKDVSPTRPRVTLLTANLSTLRPR
jgi:hypothetical protein